MTETIASLVGAIIGAIITTSFWFVQHRIEQKDDLNNERRQDKRELVKNIMRNRMNQRALCIDLNQIPLTFYDDPQAKELYRKTFGDARRCYTGYDFGGFGESSG